MRLYLNYYVMFYSMYAGLAYFTLFLYNLYIENIYLLRPHLFIFINLLLFL